MNDIYYESYKPDFSEAPKYEFVLGGIKLDENGNWVDENGNIYKPGEIGEGGITFVPIEGGNIVIVPGYGVVYHNYPIFYYLIGSGTIRFISK